MFQQNILQGPGTGTFTTHTVEILIMLLGAFLFGLWFGWVLWSRYRQTAEKLRVDNESLQATANTLRTESENLRTKMAEAETEQSSLAAQLQNLGWEAEKQRSQIAVLENDIEKIRERNRLLESEQGLGQQPEMEGTAVSFEFTAPLPSEPSAELPDLESVIAEAIDDSFDKANLDMPELEDAIADAVNAAIAEHNNAAITEEETDLPPLEPIADEPAIAIPPASDVVAPKVEALETAETPVVLAVNSGPRDDLKIVEGVGPKIEELLFKAGITTYGQLAATSVQQLKDILNDAGSRFAMHDPGTWSAQALLAANGEWENLKAYQEFLNAGKRPDK